MSRSGWHDENERNVRYYRELAREHGISFRAVDWGSRASQQRRFRVLCQVGDLDGKSILDVGCGQGDLYECLSRRGVRVRYTGIDITREMIEVARQRFPKARFRVADVLEERGRQHDYVLSSGIFGQRSAAPFEYLKAAVQRMFALAKCAVAFNTLSTWAAQQEKGEFHADPLKVAAFCRTLTPVLTLRHDYHPRDFTIYLYRSN